MKDKKHNPKMGKKEKKHKKETVSDKPIKRTIDFKKIESKVKQQMTPKANHRMYIYDPESVINGKATKVLDENTIIGFDINGKTFRVKYSKKNDCLQIDCMFDTLYIQPVTANSFMIK